MMRLMARSTAPPKPPEMSPTTVPAATPIRVAKNPMYSDSRAPSVTRAKRSCPARVGAEPVLARWTQQGAGGERVVGPGGEESVDVGDHAVVDLNLLGIDQRVEQYAFFDQSESVVNHLVGDGTIVHFKF